MIATEIRTNPFPGLRPFDEDESNLFFGREGQTDELMRRLRRHRFLAVVGTSGSGKSSLVQAGLLPSLYRGFMTQAGSSWRVALLRPGDNPIANLAEALSQANVSGSPIEDAEIHRIVTETMLRRGALGLVETVQHAQMPEQTNLLVVVDQFEELFRFKQGTQDPEVEDEAAAFVKLLLAATQQKGVPIFVVLTMRSDFLGDCAQFRDLPEAINESQYLIPRMTRDQQRSAIEGPVAVARGKITPRLVNRLLNDVGDNPDQLPVLQHALMRTWEKWVEDPEAIEGLDLKHYEAIGGIGQALSQHANEIYDQLPSDRDREIAEKLFKCLTEKGADNRGIRRPTKLRDICAVTEADAEAVIEVVEAFRGHGKSFIMPPVGDVLAEETVLDISHESLMRVWQRLGNWVEQEAQSAQTYRRLAETAALQKAGKAGFWRDPELTIGEQWRKESQPNAAWAKRYIPTFDEAMQFLAASVAARDAEKAEKEAARRREIRTAWVITAVSLVAVVVSSVSWWIAWNQSKQAALNQAESLGRYSLSLFDSGKELEAFVPAIQAGKILQSQTTTNPEGMNALQEVLVEGREQNRLEGHDNYVWSVSFSPDGKTLATGSRDNTIKLWSLETGKEIRTLKGHDNYVRSVSFSPDGKTLATGSDDKTIKLWSLETGKEIRTLKGHDNAVFSVSFSPDGKTLATGSADNTIKLWSLDLLSLDALIGRNCDIVRAYLENNPKVEDSDRHLCDGIGKQK